MRNFHPDQVANIFAYWTADNVVLSGGVISELPDMSLNRVKARSLVKVTTGPTYIASDPSFNFQPSISSASSNVRLQSTFDTALAQPSTVYLVFNNSASGNTMFWRTNAGNNTGAAGMTLNSSNQVVLATHDSSLAVSAVTATTGTKHVSCCIYNGAASYVFMDDSQAFQAGPSQGSVDADSATVMTIGNFGTAVNYAWTTMIAYSGTHDAATRRRVMQWLGLKYGISVT